MIKHIVMVFALAACAALAQAPPSLHGTVKDPSGALVPGALVQLRGPGGEQRAKSDDNGQYSFSTLQSGKYQVRVIAKGFTVAQKQDVGIANPTTLDVQLVIEAESQVVNVEEEANKVSTDPASNGGAIILGEKELAALSDDPDELEQQLQAMAGPGAGPNGGQIYIDGFTGNNMPPKASIREVRINMNPFSPEYDRPGFGRIEILTRPGTDAFHGQIFFSFNNQDFNSRSPLLAQSLPPYEQKFYSVHLTGPIKQKKASFGFDFDRRDITENAFILATKLDDNLNVLQVNEVVTPQIRMTFSPRLDYMINTNNTLVVRYQNTRNEQDNQGIGDYSLSTQAYNARSTENSLQITETAVLNATMINETRFQYAHFSVGDIGNNSTPAINVVGAFVGGAGQVGNSGTLRNSLELQNNTTWTHKTHILKWGGRVRQSFLDDTSVNNFGGTFTFFGGAGPALDANNQPIQGTSIQLQALERYRRTLLFQSMGLSPTQIQQYGGGASQFTLNAGTPLANVNQFDIGLFVNDDWRMRQNLTLSYGLRFETQSNIHDFSDWSPRIALAWGIDGRATKPAKTVFRAGFGVFYDRIADTQTLADERYNGLAQQSYFIQNPLFFPVIPSLGTLASGQQPQQLQILYSGVRAPRTYQASLGIDRQINKYARLAVNYIESRGVDLLRMRNINAPVNGAYPFGDPGIRLLSETDGFSRTHQLIVSPNINYKNVFLFGFYGLSYGRSDNEGMPQDPYNLRAEWGPSSFADIRQRAVIGTNVPLHWGIAISPFLMTQSGSPYNITVGHDINGDGFTAERPALVSSAACQGGTLFYASGFGCFNVNPAPGTPTISRNFGRGPASVTLNLRIAKTWAFGNKEQASGPNGPFGGMPPPGHAPGPPGGGGGGHAPMGGGGGPMMVMMGGSTAGKKYNVTLSANASNVLNHPNFAAPSGDLSSPFFGDYRRLAGGFGPMGGGSSTYNRKVDLQVRFGF